MTSVAQDTQTKVTVVAAYGVIFPVALLGNLVVILLVMRIPGMRSVTNLLLVNMSVANLLVTLVAMPYSVFLLYVPIWLSGTVGTLTCKAIHFSYALPIAASIFALLLISLDRYYAVMRPFHRIGLLKRARLATVVIWVSSAIVISPYLVQFKVIEVEGQSQCMLDWSSYGIDTKAATKIYFIFVFVFLYSLPLLVIAVTYFLIGRKLWLRRIPGHQTRANLRAAERSKRKVIKMLIIVVMAFAFSWIPAHVMHFIIYWDSKRFEAIPSLVLMGSFWFCHSYSAISPCLFLTLNENFRVGFFRLFRCRSGVTRQGGPASTSFSSPLVKNTSSTLPMETLTGKRVKGEQKLCSEASSIS